MVVLRRLDALLEETKEEVMEEVRFQREEAKFVELDPEGLREASGYVFYNTSEWTLQRLYDTATNNQQILESNFKAYLDGFSENVKEIIDKFKLRSQVRHMAAKDVLLDVLEKFTSPSVNMTPNEKLDPQNPNPRGAHETEKEEDELTIIVRSFNERWFQGWEATPEEQRVKFITIARHVKEHPNFKKQYLDNPDTQNRELALVQMIGDAIRKQRRNELDMYRLYSQDEGFRQEALQDSIRRIVG
jgi:type I restriction-modification system DNA methylase subunit